MIGLQAFPLRRMRRFESEPATIAALNTFEHTLGDVPDVVTLTLVCDTGNNGYLKNDEIPLESLYFRSGASDFNGRPAWVIRMTPDSVRVQIEPANVLFLDTSINSVAFTASEWKLKCVCLKFRPI